MLLLLLLLLLMLLPLLLSPPAGVMWAARASATVRGADSVLDSGSDVLV
jgi:hypothetical protein